MSATTAVPATSAVLIDRPGAADRDDGIGVVRSEAGWRAWVHVADVARVVPLGGTTDVEACRRGWTSYHPDRTVAMLPAAEQEAAALRAGRPVPTCLTELSIGPDGTLSDIRVRRGSLVEAVEASYEEAAGALRDPDHPLHRMLSDAYDAAQVLLAKRRAAGALAVYDLRRGWATDEDGRIVTLGAPERNAGYLIVQELMVAANEAAASWAVARELPLLFRNHRAGTATREELVDALAVASGAAGEDRVATVARHLSMVLRPAVYEPRVGGHFGLNLPAYAHATSPLRRYPDLVNQRILLAAADGRNSPYQLSTLEETAAAINLRHEARRARKAARFRSAAHQAARAELARGEYRSLDDGTFGKLVSTAVAEERFSPALAEELLRRLDEGRLLPRDAAAPLLAAAGAHWRAARERLLGWLAAEPAHAITVLAMHAQRDHGAEVRWEERPVGSRQQPMFAARARLGGAQSPPRVAPSKRAARQQAALALLATLAGLPDPSGDQAAPEPTRASPATRHRVIPAGHPPAMAVNELAQVGRLAELSWSYASDGAPHEPVHTCTVTVRQVATGERLVASATGATKSAAKAAAAAALWDQLAAEASPP